jgi:D-serine deaminase-like pyridoxal phosphate-dependent protein
MDVDTPALLLDLEQVEGNIEYFQRRASASRVLLRPHAKAHKTREIAELQLASGAAGLCCAKLSEAEALVSPKLRDFLITSPVIGVRKIGRLMALARQAKIAVVADDAGNIAELAEAARQSGAALDVMVDVDVGQGRTGVPPGPAAAMLAAQIGASPSLRFRGLQAYQGKLQSVPDRIARGRLVREAMDRLADSVRHLHDAGLNCAAKSGGGTGSFLMDLELGELNELQPGSYVTMDSTYGGVDLGGDGNQSLGQPLSILATVISRPAPDRAVVDVGWKSASSDAGAPLVRGMQGLEFEFAGDEHGIVRSLGAPLTLVAGDRVELVPSHCDTTVNLYDRFLVHRKGIPQAEWLIVGRGKSQ